MKKFLTRIKAVIVASLFMAAIFFIAVGFDRFDVEIGLAPMASVVIGVASATLMLWLMDRWYLSNSEVMRGLVVTSFVSAMFIPFLS